MPYGDRDSNVVRLQRFPAQGESSGVAAGLRTWLCAGRAEIVTAGPNPEFGFIKSDPYDTNVGTGLVVPPTPSSAIGDARYLFVLARASFASGEVGTRLVGIRQYAELIARIPAGQEGQPITGGTPGSTVVFRQPIKQPLWHPPDGDISWHVMVVNRPWRDRRHPANADGFIFRDSYSPALLFEQPSPYVPPNDGRPWGTPIAASLGTIHELRYRARSNDNEYSLDIPVPIPSEVIFFASVRQNNPATNPALADPGLTQQFFALSKEDRFLVAYPQFAQYGVIYGSLVFDQNLGEDVP